MKLLVVEGDESITDSLSEVLAIIEKCKPEYKTNSLEIDRTLSYYDLVIIDHHTVRKDGSLDKFKDCKNLIITTTFHMDVGVDFVNFLNIKVINKPYRVERILDLISSFV